MLTFLQQKRLFEKTRQKCPCLRRKRVSFDVRRGLLVVATKQPERTTRDERVAVVDREHQQFIAARFQDALQSLFKATC